MIVFRPIECEQGVDEKRGKCERDHGKELERVTIRESSAKEPNHEDTHERLPADVLHECVHDLGQQLSANPRSPDFRWVSIHTCFPLPTGLEHVRYNIPFTEVVLVQHGTSFDLLDDVWVQVSVISVAHRGGFSYPWNVPISSVVRPSER